MDKVSENLKAIESEYIKGVTISEIAHKYSGCKKKIAKALREKGVKIRSRGNESNSHYDEMKRLYDEGMSLQDLSIKYSLAISTIYAGLDRRGCKFRPSNWSRPQRKYKLPIDVTNAEGVKLAYRTKPMGADTLISSKGYLSKLVRSDVKNTTLITVNEALNKVDG